MREPVEQKAEDGAPAEDKPKVEGADAAEGSEEEKVTDPFKNKFLPSYYYVHIKVTI